MWDKVIINYKWRNVMNRSFVFLLGIIFISASLFSGCSFKHTIKINPPLEELPEVAREPCCVGVYYSPDFRTYQHRRASGPHWVIAPLGEASIAMFDRVFPMVFEKVVQVTDLPPFLGKQDDIVAVIEPRIEAFHFRLGMEKESERCSVTYRITVYTLDGVPVSSWIVKGKGAASYWDSPVWNHINLDMQDAAIKVIREFHESLDSGNLAFLSKSRAQEYQKSAPPLDKNLVFAAAQPFVNPERLKEEFGIPLNEAGIIVIKVSLRNDSEQALLVRGSDIHLVLSDGKRIAPVCPMAVTSKLEEVSHTGAAVAAIFGAGLGLLASFAEDAEKSKKRIELINKLQAKQLGERVLGKSDAAEAFVYFIPAQGTPAFNEASLAFWVIEPDTAGGIRVELPLENLEFGGAPAQK
jgi:hypothetical protein